MNQLTAQLKTTNEAGGHNSNPGRQIDCLLTTCCDAHNLTPEDPAGNLQLHEKEKGRRLFIGSHDIALVPLPRWVIPP